MGSTLEIGSDFEAAKVEVIAAMLFPRDERLRSGYALRNAWASRIASDPSVTAAAGEVEALLDLPSRRELRNEAAEGVKTGSVAGDLLGMIYEQSRLGADEPSMRGALLHYRKWSIGRKYGDGEALKYSDRQLRHYFTAAAPAAHLWAAFRLLQQVTDGGKAYRSAFKPNGFMFLLGVARSVQDFAEAFIPKRTSPPKPLISGEELHRLPDHIVPVELNFRPL